MSAADAGAWGDIDPEQAMSLLDAQHLPVAGKRTSRSVSRRLFVRQRFEEADLRAEELGSEFGELGGAFRRELDDMGTPVLRVRSPDHPSAGLERIQEQTVDDFSIWVIWPSLRWLIPPRSASAPRMARWPG